MLGGYTVHVNARTDTQGHYVFRAAREAHLDASAARVDYNNGLLAAPSQQRPTNGVPKLGTGLRLRPLARITGQRRPI